MKTVTFIQSLHNPHELEFHRFMKIFCPGHTHPSTRLVERVPTQSKILEYLTGT